MNVLKRLKNLEEAVRRQRPVAGEGVSVSEGLTGTVISTDGTAPSDTGMFHVSLEHFRDDDGEVREVIVCRNTDLDEPEDFSDDIAGDVLVNNHDFLMKAWRHPAAPGIVALHFTAPAERELLVSESRRHDADEDFGECEFVLHDGETLPQPTDMELYYPVARIVREPEGDGALQVTQCHRPLGAIGITWRGPCYDLLRDQLENGYYAVD